MSRTGKKPIAIPSNVQLSLNGQSVTVKGPKGELAFTVHEDVEIIHEQGALTLKPRMLTQRARAMWGLGRAMIANCVTGVTTGFTKTLEINGVGYKAALQGKNLKLSLGYSHDIDFPVPDGIQIATPKPTEIIVTGIDRQRVGEVAAKIRKYRGPEPYKGKGVKYAGEFIFRKEGKKK